MSIGKQDLQELAQGLGEYQQRYATNLARTEALMGDPSRLNVLLQEQQLEETREKQAETEQMEEQLQEAILSGDTNKALALAAGLNKGSIVQFLQSKQRADQPYLIGDGRFTVTPTNGELDISVNQGVIDTYEQLEEEERAAKSKFLPSSLIKSEDEDYLALEQHTNLQTDINRFVKNIDEGKLEVGFGEDIQAFFGNLGFKDLDTDSQQKLNNYNDLKRFVTRYVNDILRLNKGPQTDGDAARALDELRAAKTTSDLKRVLETLKNVSNREINYRKTQINRRRANVGVKGVDFDKPTWKIVE